MGRWKLEREGLLEKSFNTFSKLPFGFKLYRSTFPVVSCSSNWRYFRATHFLMHTCFHLSIIFGQSWHLWRKLSKSKKRSYIFAKRFQTFFVALEILGPIHKKEKRSICYIYYGNIHFNKYALNFVVFVNFTKYHWLRIVLMRRQLRYYT